MCRTQAKVTQCVLVITTFIQKNPHRKIVGRTNRGGMTCQVLVMPVATLEQHAGTLVRCRTHRVPGGLKQVVAAIVHQNAQPLLITAALRKDLGTVVIVSRQIHQHTQATRGGTTVRCIGPKAPPSALPHGGVMTCQLRRGADERCVVKRVAIVASRVKQQCHSQRASRRLGVGLCVKTVAAGAAQQNRQAADGVRLRVAAGGKVVFAATIH